MDLTQGKNTQSDKSLNRKIIQTYQKCAAACEPGCNNLQPHTYSHKWMDICTENCQESCRTYCKRSCKTGALSSAHQNTKPFQ